LANLQAAKKSCELWMTGEKMGGKEGKAFGNEDILCLGEWHLHKNLCE